MCSGRARGRSGCFGRRFRYRPGLLICRAVGGIVFSVGSATAFIARRMMSSSGARLFPGCVPVAGVVSRGGLIVRR